MSASRMNFSNDGNKKLDKATGKTNIKVVKDIKKLQTTKENITEAKKLNILKMVSFEFILRFKQSGDLV